MTFQLEPDDPTPRAAGTNTLVRMRTLLSQARILAETESTCGQQLDLLIREAYGLVTQALEQVERGGW